MRPFVLLSFVVAVAAVPMQWAKPTVHKQDHHVYSYRYQRGHQEHPQTETQTRPLHSSRITNYGHKKYPRKVSLTAPPPCQPMSPPPDEATTKERFDKFAHAFLVTKNITEAFTYINAGYINHNPAAKNGSASAWGILSPIWGSQSITVLRTAFKGNTGWLNYRAGGLGEVVDRYRWEDGCIAEHWDQGEKFPSS